MNRRAALLPLLYGLLTAAIVRCWLMPLPSSFWVDETATAFVVHYGGEHPSFAAAPVPASIYYVLPRAAEKLLGSSEAAYRLPSLLLMAVALWTVARLAARLIHPRAAWFAAFACLALHGFNEQAADARPYAMGSAVAALAVWFLVRWLDTGKWGDAAAFGVLAALLWRVHLLFAPFYLIFAIYAGVRLAQRKSRVGWLPVALVFGAVALSLVPVAWSAAALFRQAGAHLIVEPPTPRDAANSLKYGLLLVCGLGAWLASRVVWRRAATSVPCSVEDVALVVSWWLVPPVSLFVLSWVAGSSVFVARYYSLGLAGTALAATLCASRSMTAEMWRPAAAVLGAGALLAAGQWGHWWPMHQHSDWRNAAREVAQLAPDASVPVICPSPFVEAKPPVWNPDYRLPGFLYAHLAEYPLRGRVLPFPFDDSPQADQYAAQLSRATLSRRTVRDLWRRGPGGLLVEMAGGASQLAGWTSRRVGDFGDVTVVQFAR